MAILAALFFGVVGFLALGVGAAIWMGSIYGSNSGGTEMSCMFTFGPLGALAGILLGVGLVLHFNGGSAGWAKGLMIGAASLTGLAVVVLSGFALAHPHSPPRQAYSLLYFEVELPAASVVDAPTWGFTPEGVREPSGIYKSCSGDVCTFTMTIAPEDNYAGGSVTLALGADRYSFSVDLPSVLHDLDWCDWRPSGAPPRSTRCGHCGWNEFRSCAARP